MFTASSKPTMAKNASAVAAVIAVNTLCPSRCELGHVGKIALAAADRPQADRDDDQEPGQLDHGQDDVELDALADAAEVHGRDEAHEGHGQKRDAEPALEGRSKAALRLAANARDAVEAEVIPEHITVKATMKVMKWMPNALCV